MECIRTLEEAVDAEKFRVNSRDKCNLECQRPIVGCATAYATMDVDISVEDYSHSVVGSFLDDIFDLGYDFRIIRLDSYNKIYRCSVVSVFSQEHARKKAREELQLFLTTMEVVDDER